MYDEGMKKHDVLVDSASGFLARRKGQEITPEVIGDFTMFLWKRKKQSDLELMREMVNRRYHVHT